MKIALPFIFLLFLFSQAQGSVRLDVDTEIGRGYLGTNLGVSEFLQTAEDKVYFSQWNVSAGGNQSKYEDSTTGEISTTRGRQGSFGVGIGYDKKWNLDASLFANSTPETQFGESGGNLQLSYTLKNIAESDYGFSLGVGSGKSKIGQKISFRIFNTTVNRDVELDKTESSFFFNLYAFSGLILKVDYQAYKYSRSKADLQAAYASRFLNYYTSDLVNSIGGLPEYSGAIGATVAISEDWDVSAQGRRTHLIVDDSNSQRYQFYGDHYFETWTGGIGVSRSETAQGLETSLLSRFSFDF